MDILFTQFKYGILTKRANIICFIFGKFNILHGYNEKITIYEPTKEGWTHINYYLPYEYESVYNKLSEVILLLKQYRLNEKLERINKDF